MNVKNVDTASVNEESSFKDKFLDTFMNKEVILPTIGVIVALVAIWAFMTKCGKRKCCKEEEKHDNDVQTRKSVKSDRSQSDRARSSDPECSSNLTNGVSDKSSAGIYKG